MDLADLTRQIIHFRKMAENEKLDYYTRIVCRQKYNKLCIQRDALLRSRM